MSHLESAMAVAHELNESTTEYLIECAIDEARAQQTPSLIFAQSPKDGTADYGAADVNAPLKLY